MEQGIEDMDANDIENDEMDGSEDDNSHANSLGHLSEGEYEVASNKER